ncbi:MAG: RNA polymerase factor sigma-54 [Lachnospiraceae bacterium]
MELKTEMQQRTSLSVHMQQCLEILTMDNAQLGEFITEQAMENPLLELADCITWINDKSTVVRIEKDWSAEDDEEVYEKEIAVQERPNSDLYFQLSGYHMNAEIQKAAEYIIESLDERGYFTDDIKETARVLKTSMKIVKEALKIVKQLEPKGVGASDLQECLLIQLESSYPDEIDAKEIIAKGLLGDFAQGKYEKIAKKTGKTVSQIRQAGDVIRKLNPKPFDNEEPAVRNRYLTADIVLVKYDDHYDIILNQEYLPELSLNKTYLELLKKGADEATKKYICEKYEKAQWIRSCIKRRQETLLRMTELIFQYQNNFLLEGPPGLRPLKLKTVADDMQMHVSTVSRAVKGKYIQTKWGIYPLRYFFSSGIETEEGRISPAQVRSVIGRLIQKEDKAHPLSDSRLEAMLREHGIVISRRTVASYREQMNIPSSTARKIRVDKKMENHKK